MRRSQMTAQQLAVRSEILEQLGERGWTDTSTRGWVEEDLEAEREVAATYTNCRDVRLELKIAFDAASLSFRLTDDDQVLHLHLRPIDFGTARHVLGSLPEIAQSIDARSFEHAVGRLLSEFHEIRTDDHAEGNKAPEVAIAPPNTSTELVAAYAQTGWETDILEPATAEVIEELAAVAGCLLPYTLEQYLRTLTRAHPFVGGYLALSPNEIVADAKRLQELDRAGTFQARLDTIDSWNDGRWANAKLERAYWSAGWIPFAADSVGNLLCVDLLPGPAGRVGQLVEVEFQDGQGPYLSGFPDLARLLAVQRRLLEAGHFEIDDGGFAYDDSPALLRELIAAEPSESKPRGGLFSGNALSASERRRALVVCRADQLPVAISGLNQPLTGEQQRLYSRLYAIHHETAVSLDRFWDEVEEPPLEADLDEGMEFLDRLGELVMCDPLLGPALVGDGAYSKLFHTAAPEVVKDWLERNGHILVPFEDVLTRLAIFDVQDAEGRRVDMVRLGTSRGAKLAVDPTIPHLVVVQVEDRCLWAGAQARPLTDNMRIWTRCGTAALPTAPAAGIHPLVVG